ncbi:MAG: tetratricopeptide repeat protein [Myxococcales bacterium]|nr:tetratricopeptide repeat protein [Myxococcales bacterium]MCB9714970.1 tetratricopeptide repeat protein [Myxococcales bacterium]
MAGERPLDQPTLDEDVTVVGGPLLTSKSRGQEPDDEAPRFLGRYVVVDELGRGGMGQVFRAYDPKLDREVALKLLRRVNDDARLRLLREAQAMAQLSHPNVLPVYDVALEGHRLFIAMELVRGQSLRQWLDERPRAWSEVLPIMIAAGRGLAAVHAAGLVHRDFKPGNVLIGDDGRVRVMDFGLVRGTGETPGDGDTRTGGESRSRSDPSQELLPVASPLDTIVGELSRVSSIRMRATDTHEVLTSLHEELTRNGTVVGTPAYMAPEQHLGRGADRRSDQYGFCVTLWEAIYGVRPFKAETQKDLYQIKASGELELDPTRTVPRWLCSLMTRGLSPRPSVRFETMEALLLALERGRHRRRRIVWALGGVALLGGTIGASQLAPEPAPCDHAHERLAQVWSDAAAERIERAMADTELAYAADTWDRVEPKLQDYAERWTASRRDACEATRVRHEQPEALMDARMRCLDERLRGLRALVGILEDADAEVVERASSAVGGLPPIEQCDDPQYVQAQVPPPSDPELAARVEAHEEELARLDAQNRAGKAAQVLPDAQAALERARELEHPPLVARAELSLADIEESLGRYEDSRAHYEGAYFDARRDGLDTVQARAAIQLMHLVGDRMGQPDEAQRWARFAEAALERVSDPAVRASYLNNAGLLAGQLADYDLAIERLEEALARRRELHGPEHETVAAVLNNLALMYDEKGDYQRALALHEQALAIRERLHGPEHPKVAASLLNMSNIHRSWAQLDEALRLQLRAREIWKKAYGPDHPHTAGTLVNLGAIYAAQDEHEEALQSYREALEVLERTQGPLHRNVAGTLVNMGLVYEELGQLELAAEHLARGLEILEKTLGEDDPLVSLVLINTGHLAHERGDPDAAMADYERALAILGKTVGLEHPQAATVFGNMAAIHEERGQLDLARDELRRATAIRRDKLGPTHPDTAFSLRSLGRVQLARGEAAAAIEPLTEAQAAFESMEDHADALELTRFELARARWELGDDRGQARAQVLRARAALRGLEGDDHEGELEEIEQWLRAHPG